MVRHAIVMAAVGILFLLSQQDAAAQASKRLEKKPVGTTQRSSWEQVDQINKEADGTKARYHQSRQSAGLNKRGYTGGNVKASTLFPKATKPTAAPRKAAPATKPRKR